MNDRGEPNGAERISSQHSVTGWFDQLRDGKKDAADKLWEAYFQRLVVLAKQKLANQNRRVNDEEDIAISVFTSLCRNAEKGLLPDIQNRNDLWRVLFSMTQHRVIDQFRAANVQKRGGGKVQGESAVDFNEVGNDQLAPDLMMEMNENYQAMLKVLRNDTLRKIAVWKLEGFSSQEIADKLNVAERTVQRKLQLIREDWNDRNGKEI